ncbi:redoxin family protein [Alloacidobacterium dinghuense]|uniref:Redoxin family protein n=1 Tax=Alloacidobacterium dinghuense TaxID=2763107 RepID=A0A7G8BCJ1_9BACT|nr:redoxin family protein [Alloacidobacterium dinghuense]QNI30261.1 redoxin family protein [Alloacidobacterium dinghuense]
MSSRPYSAKKIALPEIAVRWCLAVAILLLAWPAEAQSAPFGIELDGTPVATLASPGTRVVVLFFAASDCPISNRYLPELMRLKQEYAARGVQFWEVYPNPDETAAKLKQHAAQFGDTDSVILDKEQSLVRMAKVRVTPEAAVFLRDENDLREVYHGRIDDRYLSLGSERPRAQHHELEDAIAAALENRAAPQPGGAPVGCAIVTRQP